MAGEFKNCFLAGKWRNDFFSTTIQGPTNAANTLPDVEKHVRAARAVVCEWVPWLLSYSPTRQSQEAAVKTHQDTRTGPGGRKQQTSKRVVCVCCGGPSGCSTQSNSSSAANAPKVRSDRHLQPKHCDKSVLSSKNPLYKQILFKQFAPGVYHRRSMLR